MVSKAHPDTRWNDVFEQYCRLYSLQELEKSQQSSPRTVRRKWLLSGVAFMMLFSLVLLTYRDVHVFEYAVGRSWFPYNLLDGKQKCSTWMTSSRQRRNAVTVDELCPSIPIVTFDARRSPFILIEHFCNRTVKSECSSRCLDTKAPYAFNEPNNRKEYLGYNEENGTRTHYWRKTTRPEFIRSRCYCEA